MNNTINECLLSAVEAQNEDVIELILSSDQGTTNADGQIINICTNFTECLEMADMKGNKLKGTITSTVDNGLFIPTIIDLPLS